MYNDHLKTSGLWLDKDEFVRSARALKSIFLDECLECTLLPLVYVRVTVWEQITYVTVRMRAWESGCVCLKEGASVYVKEEGG